MRPASPALRCRRRARSTILATVLLPFLPHLAHASAPCSTPGTGWCVARRFTGDVPNGELGFRFGEPLDADGDGHPDVPAGSRWKLAQKVLQNGNANVWSGATGARLRTWDGPFPEGMFGHWVMLVPDLSGDGLADVVIAAPSARVGNAACGIVVARSPKSGDELWKHELADGENLGWDLAQAGDQDGDGRLDFFVGAPSQKRSRVLLLSGRDGSVLKTYTPTEDGDSFGWYVDRLDDLDGDGRPDLAVGAPTATHDDGKGGGAAWILSAASGKELRYWTGTDPRGGFGGVLAAVADLDDDGKRDLAVGVPFTEEGEARAHPGDVFVYSTGTGKELRHWSGRQPGEQFGRMIVSAGDLDGDGVDDVAVGAPWHRRDGGDKVGRVELRSAKTGDVLSELFGDEALDWFGWHIRRAPDPEGRGRPALLIGALRHPVDGQAGVGVIDWYVWRGGPSTAQGTITRGTRRSDIK